MGITKDEKETAKKIKDKIIKAFNEADDVSMNLVKIQRIEEFRRWQNPQQSNKTEIQSSGLFQFNGGFCEFKVVLTDDLK